MIDALSTIVTALEPANMMEMEEVPPPRKSRR
jgi:hypothetical protein